MLTLGKFGLGNLAITLPTIEKKKTSYGWSFSSSHFPKQRAPCYNRKKRQKTKEENHYEKSPIAKYPPPQTNVRVS